MTEINFYNITKSSVEKLLPRLLEKILEEGSSIAFLFKNIEVLQYMDDFLWTYKRESFIPHSTDDSMYNNSQPILLSLKDENINNADVLITIEGFLTENINNYMKIIDIFDGNDKEIFEDALVRIEKIKNKGYKVSYWNQDDSGWKKTEQY